MNFRDSNQDSGGIKYISKKVMINGQFVTLYSANGQTWVSSPEDIPALMERLDNARVTLNTGERVAEGEGAKVAQPEPKEKKEPQEAPERVLSTKYRMKGPKPRPILRQDGVVIKGTPIDPISASNAVMSFSSDVKDDEKATGKAAKSAKSAKDKPTKIIAPVVTKKPAKVVQQGVLNSKKAPPAANAKKVAAIRAPGSSAKANKAPMANKSQGKPAKKSAAPKAVTAKVVAKKAPAKSAKATTKAPAKKAKASKKSAGKAKQSKR